MPYTLITGVVLLTLSNAQAAITDYSSTILTRIDADARINEATFFNQQQTALIDLDAVGISSQSRELTAELLTTTTATKNEHTSSFSATSDAITLTIDARASTAADYQLAEESHVQLIAVSAYTHITSFLTTETIRLDLNGLVNTSTPADPSTFLSSFRLVLRPQGSNEELLSLIDVTGKLSNTITLAPGAYSVALLVHGETIVSGLHEPGSNSVLRHGTSAQLNISITTIPAPAATLLFPLAAALSTRRRR